MSRIRTRLTQLLGITTPVICAPMATASGGALAGEVSRAGGFGFFAAGYETPETIKRELDIAKSILPGNKLSIGVGFLGWQMDAKPDNALEILSTCLQERVTAVWFAFGDNLGRWIQHVRRHEEPGVHTVIFVQVNSVTEALIAYREWKVDVIVLQGIESGGHGSASAPPLRTLLAAVLPAIPEDGPVIVGAGGLANGTQVASLLVAGASGAALGTRFLLAPQSLYSDRQRAALIAASGAESTVRTTAFDVVRGTTGWPSGIDGRALNNLTVQEVESGENVEEVRRKFQEAAKVGETDRMLVWAGTGVGLMDEVKDAGDIVREIHSDVVHAATGSSISR